MMLCSCCRQATCTFEGGADYAEGRLDRTVGVFFTCFCGTSFMGAGPTCRGPLRAPLKRFFASLAE
jgi:hypothetical protein